MVAVIELRGKNIHFHMIAVGALTGNCLNKSK